MTTPSETPLFHVVGFSGHRQIIDPDGLAKAIAAALESLRQRAPGEWLGLSSVAEGGDQLFISQVRALGMSWHAILPLPRSEFARDFPPAEWEAVERILDQAEHVRIITENGTRDDAYLDCGMATVDGSDVLIAVWDGEPARGRGGTGDVVSYARSLGRPLILIDANTLRVSRENLEKLERVDSSLAKLNELPATMVGGAENPFRAPSAIFAFQQKCDHAASRGAPQFRRLIVLTVLLHLAATLIAAAALSAWPCCSGITTIRTTTGCAAGWRRSSAARCWPPGACPAPRPSSRTSTCPRSAASPARSTSCTAAQPPPSPCRSRSSGRPTLRNASTTSSRTTGARRPGHCRCSTA